MEQTKKISFGFTKLTKKPNITSKEDVEKKDVELIECLEGHSIKLKHAVEEVKGPLIIPLKDNSKNLIDRIKHSKRSNNKSAVEEDTRPDSELTLDELAARQLLQETKKTEEIKSETKVFSLPSVTNQLLILKGENEPTLDDYESVPISDYGLAMLRGMGWSEGMGIGKQNRTVVKTLEPELRPKGMGLGANKMINAEKKEPAVDKDGTELSLVKGAYAKIIAGKHKGSYCKIIGLDDEAGRIIVETALKKLILSLNEFLLIPVTQEEYVKLSKVLNNAKYEAYKERDIKKEEISIKQEPCSSSDYENSEQNIDLKTKSSSNAHSYHERKSSEKNYSRQRHDSESSISDRSMSEYKSSSRSRSELKGKEKFTDKTGSSKNRNRKESDSSDYSYKRKERRERKKKKSKKQKHKSRRNSSSSDESRDKNRRNKDHKYSKSSRSSKR